LRMHKGASSRTGGTSLTGWSTAKPTTPTDYRGLKRWRDDAKKKKGKSRSEREAQRFRAELLKLARNNQPPPTVIPPILQAEIAAAGGIVGWAVAQAKRMIPVKKRPFPRSGSRLIKRS